ncbi:MAG: NTP transferase domain-containing protein [Desulfatiglandaceae bacterium]|jgi:bifunctional UDP-N-acetylglucosamine pyrophosphorylase / glucosamine-1-phosphate N-acetyltransferase
MAGKKTQLENRTASVVMAAGRGSRMKGFEGNKTLLPLVPLGSSLEGDDPILIHILKNLPTGPKAIVVHHRERAVMDATRGLDVTYCRQPVLNGTGGALLVTKDFLNAVDCDRIIVTMGDIPLVRPATYSRLIAELEHVHLAVLGFKPSDRKQYGLLEMAGDRVVRIMEWKYWKDLPRATLKAYTVCNSGIYAARKKTLLPYLDKMASQPHLIQKEINGEWTRVEEFFVTDMVALMHGDGLEVGCILAKDELEVMGVDDLAALDKAQSVYRGRFF